MSDIIEKIKIYSIKGEAGKEVTEARLIENMGLEGDLHAKGGERQLSLLLAETRVGKTGQEERGLCSSRFKANISIRGLAQDAVRPGARLTAGEGALEITGETKHCHKECALFQAGKTCSLAGMNLFAKVLKGGIIRVGDGVEIHYAD